MQHAAVVIQSAYGGLLQRRAIKGVLHSIACSKAALVIQATCVRTCLPLQGRKQVRTQGKVEAAAAVRIQRTWRQLIERRR